MKWFTRKLLKIAVKLYFFFNKDSFCFHIGTKHPEYDYTVKLNTYPNFDQQRRMSMTDLDKAIKVLKEQYEKVKKIGWIRNPIAYALYQTWKIFDKQEE